MKRPKIQNQFIPYQQTETFRDLLAEQPEICQIARVVIHRINFPKSKGDAVKWKEIKPYKISRNASLAGKQRPRLSSHDEQEVFGIVALCFVAAKFSERGRVPWLSIFRHVRWTLRIGKAGAKKEVHNYDAIEQGIEPQISLTLSPEERIIQRLRLKPKIQIMIRQILNAAKRDKSRKARQAKKSALQFLRFIVSNSKGDTGIGRADVLNCRNPARESKALADRAAKFRAYLAQGDFVIEHKSFATL